MLSEFLELLAFRYSFKEIYFKKLYTLFQKYKTVKYINRYGYYIDNFSELKTIFSIKFHNKDISRIQALQLPNLVCLDLSKNRISKIKNLSHLTKLEYLYLDKNYIDRITALENLKQLKYLDLSYNKIDSIGRNLDNLKNLEYIKINCNPIKTRLDHKNFVYDCYP